MVSPQRDCNWLLDVCLHLKCSLIQFTSTGACPGHCSRLGFLAAGHRLLLHLAVLVTFSGLGMGKMLKSKWAATIFSSLCNTISSKGNSSVVTLPAFPTCDCYYCMCHCQAAHCLLHLKCTDQDSPSYNAIDGEQLIS